MKDIGSQYVDEFERILKSLKDVFGKVTRTIREFKKELKEMAETTTAETKAEIERAMKKVKEQTERLEENLMPLKSFVEAPGKIVDGVCNVVRSLLSWSKVDDGCGFPKFVPDVDIDIPNITLDHLKPFLKILAPDMDFIDFDLDQGLSKLETSSISKIRKKLTVLLDAVFNVLQLYAKYAEKICYLSIILIFWDAYSYMYQYYSDDAFDNMFVDSNLERLWKSGDKEKITPLRNWELKMKYQYSTSFKLSKKEGKDLFIKSLPTLFFIIICGGILGFDACLNEMLKAFTENAQFGIAYEGMEAGIKFSELIPGLKSGTVTPQSIKLRGLNLTTEPCLPVPQQTEYANLAIIGALLCLCLFSCVLDVFGARLRAKICNMIFEDRAAPRAEYLYQRIKQGRTSRRFQFNMLVGQQLDISDLKKEFCSCCTCMSGRGGISSIFLTIGKKKQSKCIVCKNDFLKEEGKLYRIKQKSETKELYICADCNYDAM